MSILFQHVNFVYPERERFSLQDVNLEFVRGENIGIIGASGSGKTTLAYLLKGIYSPTRGNISVQQSGTEKKNYFMKHVGLVFQFPEHQFFAETVKEEILFAAKNYDIHEQKREELIENLLGEYDFLSKQDLSKNPLNFSGGEKRLIAIASILITKPDYLILDEPTIGLDNYYKQKILALLKNYNSSNNSIIIISHDLDFLSKIIEQIIILEKGKVIFKNTIECFYSDTNIDANSREFYPEKIVLLNKLKEKGWNFSRNNLTLNELTNKIRERIRKHERNNIR